MIRKILTTYAARLDEYLARSHRQPEGVAEVGLIGSAGEQCPNKLVVSLVNLEREASGDGGYMQRAATGYAGRRQPLLLNMHIMMAAGLFSFDFISYFVLRYFLPVHGACTGILRRPAGPPGKTKHRLNRLVCAASGSVCRFRFFMWLDRKG